MASHESSGANMQNKDPIMMSSRPRRSSSASTSLSLKPPRTPRFAEATAVNSPIEQTQATQSPFADSAAAATNHYHPQPQPSDVGFGYIAGPEASRGSSYPGVPVEIPLTPKSPLKSALRVPGTPARQLENPLSPTFREEQILEKREAETEKENAKDLKAKIRVRLAKVVLRGISFSCSLIVVSMVAAALVIFNATKHLAPRNKLPPWSVQTVAWPTIVLLVIASISLLLSILVLLAYFRGGHKRAEKTAVYYTVFSVALFAFSIVMWAIGAGILNGSKENNGGQDIWGWSCKDNHRKQLFKNDIDYDLVCRLLNWSLVCCIIEVVIEVITIAIYGVVFYRWWSKRKLRKTMDLRDKARSDLYLAQLRSQSAPNTPGFGGPMSPAFSPRPTEDAYSQAEKGTAPSPSSSTQFATAHTSFSQPKPFKLQPPPIKIHTATPQMGSEGFSPVPAPLHSPAAPGERQYDAVPIPGAYAAPHSPSYPPPMPSPGPGQSFR